MSDDLVERLRDFDPHLHEWEVVAEAADRIETLTAERDGLLRCVTDNHVALCRAEKAEAERDRLREALHAIQTYEQGYAPQLRAIAIAALKGETP